MKVIVLVIKHHILTLSLNIIVELYRDKLIELIFQFFFKKLHLSWLDQSIFHLGLSSLAPSLVSGLHFGTVMHILGLFIWSILELGDISEKVIIDIIILHLLLLILIR